MSMVRGIMCHVLSASTILLGVTLVYGEGIWFTVLPKDTIVRPNAQSCLNCQAVAAANTVSTIWLRWSKGDSILADFENKHYRVLGNNSLFFSAVLPSDIGSYRCIAYLQNGSGVALSISSPIVQLRTAFIDASFAVSPIDQAAAIGGQASFTCVSPRSLPLATVLWEKDSQAYRGGVETHIQLPNLNLISSGLAVNVTSQRDVGVYRCVALNSLIPEVLVRSKEAVLSLKATQPRPYFLMKPSSLFGAEGHPGRLDCVILGQPIPIISWYRNNILVPLDVRVTQLVNGSLVFGMLTKKDAGLYSCSGRNTHGEVYLDQPIEVQVAFIGHDFGAQPSDQNVVLGSAVRLDCEPPYSLPQSKGPTWFHNYSLVVPSDRRFVLVNGSILISHVALTDGGTYFCTATNPITRESRTSQRGRLTVLDVPRLSITRTKELLFSGDTLNLTCTAEGLPTPVVAWYRGDIKLIAGPVISLPNLRTNSSGPLACRASNIAGQTELFVMLMVIRPPILVSPRNQSVKVGMSVGFACDSDPMATYSISWHFQSDMWVVSTPLTGRLGLIVTNTSVLIPSAQLSHRGFYTCLLTDPEGMTAVTAHLDVHAPPPGLTLSLLDAELDRVSVLLELSFGNHTSCSYSLKRDSHALPTGWVKVVMGTIVLESTEVLVTGLEPGSFYLLVAEVSCKSSPIVVQSNIIRIETVSVEMVAPPKLAATAIRPLSVEVVFSEPFWILPTQYRINLTSAFGSRHWEFNSSSICLTVNCSILLDGLKPGSMYNSTVQTCRVSPRQKLICGPASDVISFATSYLVPPTAPILQNLKPLNVSCISFSVKLPVVGPGLGVPLTHFLLSLRSFVTQTVNEYNISAASQMNITLCDLHPYTEYSITSQAWTMFGGGPSSLPQIVRTMEHVPSPVRNLTVDVFDQNLLRLIWTEPDHINGLLLGYTVKVIYQNSSTIEFDPGKNTSAVLEGLGENITLTIAVYGRTAMGSGQVSNIVVTLKPVILHPGTTLILRTTSILETSSIPHMVSSVVSATIIIPSNVTESSSRRTTAIIAGSTAVLVVFMFVCFIVFFYYCRSKASKARKGFLKFGGKGPSSPMDRDRVNPIYLGDSLVQDGHPQASKSTYQMEENPLYLDSESMESHSSHQDDLSPLDNVNNKKKPETGSDSGHSLDTSEEISGPPPPPPPTFLFQNPIFLDSPVEFSSFLPDGPNADLGKDSFPRSPLTFARTQPTGPPGHMPPPPPPPPVPVQTTTTSRPPSPPLSPSTTTMTLLPPPPPPTRSAVVSQDISADGFEIVI